ncbi:RBMX2 [Lepeophtheirus salmonis]|uniref:RBMX2 n=1 Tax=Lepeophtheirus salmonis TaxID=72036 RepID=A0A7R8H186_LEPSM|nr:RBMX2 [Lepeophtheirus salmonis]CAF2806807.1 RBMX2 [Lepeophtheirus salmonis]
MNPVTNAKNLYKMNLRELELGIAGTSGSWHWDYKDSAWIFVGGLNYDLSEGDVISIFSQYGEIVHINLVRDGKTGKSKGYGFICYEDQRSTILAVDNLNAITLLKRTIRVDHVQKYKLPKDLERLDDDRRKLFIDGCAPKPLPEPEPGSPTPESSSDSNEEEGEEIVVKKKKKKKKHKRKKSSSTSSSSSSSSEDEKDGRSGRKSKKERKNKKHKKDRSKVDPRIKSEHIKKEIKKESSSEDSCIIKQSENSSKRFIKRDPSKNERCFSSEKSKRSAKSESSSEEERRDGYNKRHRNKRYAKSESSSEEERREGYNKRHRNKSLEDHKSKRHHEQSPLNDRSERDRNDKVRTSDNNNHISESERDRKLVDGSRRDAKHHKDRSYEYEARDKSYRQSDSRSHRNRGKESHRRGSDEEDNNRSRSRKYR